MVDPRKGPQCANRKARRRAGRGRRRSILSALTGAAMALLGHAGHGSAAEPTSEVAVGYAYSFYGEDSLSEDA